MATNTLLSFPARIPITSKGDIASVEFYRFLTEAIARMGGTTGNDLASVISLLAALTVSVNDDKIELAFTDHSAEIAELRKDVEDLKRQLAMVNA